jgi:cellulose synthase (UDP-forming)
VHEVKVHLLDDLGKDDRRMMCEQLGACYICRPNKGQHAKAGNMNYALSVTSGEWVMFFDADMVGDASRTLVLYAYIAGNVGT